MASDHRRIAYGGSGGGLFGRDGIADGEYERRNVCNGDYCGHEPTGEQPGGNVDVIDDFRQSDR